jgi:hypothetical protein
MTTIIVKNQSEFKNLVDLKDFRISKAIVETILKNLYTTRRFIHILTIEVTEDHAAYDITIERDDFLEGLETNLKYYENKEEYETCEKIVKGIKFLKKIQ